LPAVGKWEALQWASDRVVLRLMNPPDRYRYLDNSLIEKTLRSTFSPGKLV
jgi:hypothetical protein